MSGESFAGSLLSKAVGIVLEARTQSTVAANRNTKFNIASLSSTLNEPRQGNTLTIEFLFCGSATPCERWVWTQEASTALGERDQPEVPVLYKRAVCSTYMSSCLPLSQSLLSCRSSVCARSTVYCARCPRIYCVVRCARSLSALCGELTQVCLGRTSRIELSPR
jgi:hypothetical protein